MHTLTHDALLTEFSLKRPRQSQIIAFEEIVKARSGVLIESPTGSGKTLIGMTTLEALRTQGIGPLFYVTPTKTLVQQLAEEFANDVIVVLGRSEYPCLYYADQGYEVNAMDSPCHLLKCAHRVSQETGETEDNAEPCPYLQAKYFAKNSKDIKKIVVCTTAFFLINRLLAPTWRDIKPGCVVIDEVHRLA